MRTLVLLAAVSGGLLVALPAAAAAPVRGSIAGPITAVHGVTFTVKTTLSPTGKAKVSVTPAVMITEQATGTRADLKKGVCVMAVGQKSKTAVAARRITISGAASQCTANRRFGRGRPPGAGAGNGRPPGGGTGRPPGNGGGFNPANFGFAFGTISAVKGSTFTVKGRTGATVVTVSPRTQIGKVVTVKPAAIAVKLCAFVFGTSSDKGVTVKAQSVSLSKPRAGACGFNRRRSG
jgi:hypothetical protein